MTFVREPIKPENLSQEQKDRFKDLEGKGWFWTYSLSPQGELCRELHQRGGLSDYLDAAPLSLPIYQIQELLEP